MKVQPVPSQLTSDASSRLGYHLYPLLLCGWNADNHLPFHGGLKADWLSLPKYRNKEITDDE